MESTQVRNKKIFYGSCFFALLGALLSSYLGPKAIAWYFDPPVDIGVNCRSAVEWAMARLQLAQMAGLAPAPQQRTRADRLYGGSVLQDFHECYASPAR